MTQARPESAERARVRAHLDGFEGTWLVGWAWSEATRPCIISVRDQSGAQIAEGEASRQRPDLAALGLGRSDFGFRIHVPDLGTTKLVRVFVDGAEVRGSPLRVGQGQFDGRLFVENGYATGWVTERLQRFLPPQIDIIGPAGNIIASAPSSLDDSGGDPGFVPARFRVSLAQSFGSTELLIRACANGVPFARTSCNLRTVAHLDVCTPERWAGWIFSPDAPSVDFAIEIRRDGELIATAPCAIPRADVSAAHPGSNVFGFDLRRQRQAVPASEPCEISLRLAGTRKELFDGPLIVGPRTGVVAVARRLAQTVHAEDNTLSSPERTVLQRALADYIASLRRGENRCLIPRFKRPLPEAGHRLTIIIPIYAGVAITRDCIASVLSHRNAETDFVVVINDASPDPGMREALGRFVNTPNLLLLTNKANLGFVRSVNRALHAAPDGDIVLLNSDTEVYAGTFDELYRVAHSAPEIGTVTPLSNNATIFSYPHAELRRSELSDVPWRRLSQIARQRNVGVVIDVPTAHGFCMLIRREVLERIGPFDESFGRGYGEENDFCAKAADLGFRNVAAGSVLVRHHESVSFGDDKGELLSKNLATIASRYPEYMPTVMEFEAEDRMRSARWALDAARLRIARDRGERFTLVVTNRLKGGTAEAIRDIAETCEPAGGPQLVLSCRHDGFMQVDCDEPLLRASFSPSESRQLFRMLSAAEPALVVVHQILGYARDFVGELATWIGPFRSVFYMHDYFAICPRVTMIDSSGSFCGKPAPDVCDRCIAIGGSHEASRLHTASIEEHYELMRSLLGRFTHVIAPSANATRYIHKIYPELDVQVIAHPEAGRQFAVGPREGSDDEVLVLGAIGPHKGSAKLLEIARLARRESPQLRFRVVGYTDIDEALLALGNVQITGAYTRDELPQLMAECRGRLALFLHQWPETWSYTLSEAAAHGFVPLVPDIGAPAERVHETGFGTVFPFPIEAQEVLALIRDIAEGKRQPFSDGTSPAAYSRSPEELQRLRALFAVAARAPSDARVA